MQTRVEFQKEIKDLHEQIIRMGAAVEQSIGLAVEALSSLDVAIAQEVIDGDDAIDEMERAIDRNCVRLIALQQPVAGDLRDVTANLKLITDLERIADHAVDIARHVKAIAKAEFVFTLPHDIVAIADQTRLILNQALNAYVTRDRELAVNVIHMDKKIDKLSKRLRRYFTAQMEMDCRHIGPLVDLMMVCKHFERAGDHAQNVAEWVIYYIDGRHAAYEEEEQKHAAKTDRHR